jgi:hypothetical protein
VSGSENILLNYLSSLDNTSEFGLETFNCKDLNIQISLDDEKTIAHFNLLKNGKGNN